MTASDFSPVPATDSGTHPIDVVLPVFAHANQLPGSSVAWNVIAGGGGAAAAEKAIMPSTTRAERAIRSFFIEGSPFLVRWVQERHVTGLGLHDRASSILLSVLVADLFAWCMQPLIVLLLVSVIRFKLCRTLL